MYILININMFITKYDMYILINTKNMRCVYVYVKKKKGYRFN